MSATPAIDVSIQNKLDKLRWVATVSCLALIVLCLFWERWLAPVRPGGSWLMLKAVPLLLPLPGILKGKRYTYQWASLLLLAYLCEGLVRASSDTGLSQYLAMLETLLAGICFSSVLLFCRATRPSLTNPALKHSKRGKTSA